MTTDGCKPTIEGFWHIALVETGPPKNILVMSFLYSYDCGTNQDNWLAQPYYYGSKLTGPTLFIIMDETLID